MADAAADESLLGQELELDVGGPAAGGSCVARIGGPHGRVVFVRHALPGERVRARITEDRAGSFCRADAVEVLAASPDRVEPPCPHAGPGRCGGCDWQHASGTAQRELKAAVVRDQFARLARLELDGDVFTGVEALPGGLLGWRTRIAYAVDADGRPGLLRHASHDVERLETCPLGVPGVGDSPVLDEHWPGLRAVEVVAAGDDATSVITHRAAARPKRGRGRRLPDRLAVVEGPDRLRRSVAGRDFTVAATGFWQGHPDAVETFAAALLAGVGLRAGDQVLDLYAGAGALTAALAEAVGPQGSVIGVEADRQAVRDATANLVPWPWAEVRQARVADVEFGGRVDVVVLDPPRVGAGAAVMTAIAQAGPRAVGYVSCDPGTLARDVAALRGHGWRLTRLRAFDAYPMTQHVECVATLTPLTAT